jgi:hypothetical protein
MSVAPTADTDLISRAELIQALDRESESTPPCGVGGEFEGDDCFHDGLERAGQIVNEAPPVAPSVGPEDELISIEVICEALHVHGDRAEAAFNTELAETYDSVIEILKGRSPAPSVGELEWRECRDYKKLHLCTHEWDIYEAKYSDNVFVLQWHGGWMADCATPEAAKSLANSLQRILSGAAE